MLKKEFVEKMKNDKELHELREKVLLFGTRADAAYILGKDRSYEDYKDRLQKMIREHEATSQ